MRDWIRQAVDRYDSLLPPRWPGELPLWVIVLTMPVWILGLVIVLGLMVLGIIDE